MTNIFKRLLHLTEIFTNNSQSKFAKSIGWSQTTFNGYLNEDGQTKIRLSLLQDIMKQYPSINRNWLYFGEGDPLAKDQPGQQAGDFAELKKENDLLRAELLEEKSFSRRLSMQNSELYEECRVLKENLAFLEAGKVFARSREVAPGSPAVRNMSGGNEEMKQ